MNRLAAKTWLALVEGVVRFEEVPYVPAFCSESVTVVTENLRRGYRSQEEANRAGLEIDEALERIELDLFKEEW